MESIKYIQVEVDNENCCDDEDAMKIFQEGFFLLRHLIAKCMDGTRNFKSSLALQTWWNQHSVSSFQFPALKTSLAISNFKRFKWELESRQSEST